MLHIVANNKTGIWSHQVPNQSPALIIISVLFLLVTTVFFGLRVKERWKYRPRDNGRWRLIPYEFGPWKLRQFEIGPLRFRFWGFDNVQEGFKRAVSYDTMAAAAYTTLIIQTIFGGMAAHYGFGKHRADILPTFPKAMYYFFLYQICYKILGGFTKLTFCALYLRVFVFKGPQGFYQKHFKSLVTLTAYVVGAGTFAFTVATIFQCTPVNRAWDKRIPGHCTDNASFWYAHAAFNTLLDIIVFVLPLPVISGIKTLRRNRIGLMSTFGLGAFVIAASIARMINLRGSAASTADPTWGSMPALIWTEIEANTAVIVCCCPALAIFAKRLWRRMRTFVGQSVSLDSDSHKVPSNPAAAPPESGQQEDEPVQKEGIRSRVTYRLVAIRELLEIIWRKITGKPNPQDNDLESRPYVEGNLAYVYPGSTTEPPRAWFGRNKPHDTTSSQTVGGDDDVAPVSYLAPKVKFGGIFKKPKDVEGRITQHQDVMVSTHRRSVLEQQDEDIELKQWRRQNTEREEYQDRRFEREGGG